MWKMAFIDMYRRLILCSFLLGASASQQLSIALAVSILYVIYVREVGPMWDSTSDYLSFYW